MSLSLQGVLLGLSMLVGAVAWLVRLEARTNGVQARQDEIIARFDRLEAKFDNLSYKVLDAYLLDRTAARLDSERRRGDRT